MRRFLDIFTRNCVSSERNHCSTWLTLIFVGESWRDNHFQEGTVFLKSITTRITPLRCFEIIYSTKSFTLALLNWRKLAKKNIKISILRMIHKVCPVDERCGYLWTNRRARLLAQWADTFGLRSLARRSRPSSRRLVVSPSRRGSCVGYLVRSSRLTGSDPAVDENPLAHTHFFGPFTNNTPFNPRNILYGRALTSRNHLENYNYIKSFLGSTWTWNILDNKWQLNFIVQHDRLDWLLINFIS